MLGPIPVAHTRNLITLSSISLSLARFALNPHPVALPSLSLAQAVHRTECAAADIAQLYVVLLPTAPAQRLLALADTPQSILQPLLLLKYHSRQLHCRRFLFPSLLISTRLKEPTFTGGKMPRMKKMSHKRGRKLKVTFAEDQEEPVVKQEEDVEDIEENVENEEENVQSEKEGEEAVEEENINDDDKDMQDENINNVLALRNEEDNEEPNGENDEQENEEENDGGRQKRRKKNK